MSKFIIVALATGKSGETGVEKISLFTSSSAYSSLDAARLALGDVLNQIRKDGFTIGSFGYVEIADNGKVTQHV